MSQLQKKKKNVSILAEEKPKEIDVTHNCICLQIFVCIPVWMYFQLFQFFDQFFVEEADTIYRSCCPSPSFRVLSLWLHASSTAEVIRSGMLLIVSVAIGLCTNQSSLQGQPHVKQCIVV